MKTQVLKIALLTATAGIGVATMGAASAMLPDTVTHKEIVHFGDLNLNTSQGAERLYLRLDRAARTVCGESDLDELSLQLWRSQRSCEQKAVGNAVTQLNRPKLTAVFDRHVGPGIAKAAQVPLVIGKNSATFG